MNLVESCDPQQTFKGGFKGPVESAMATLEWTSYVKEQSDYLLGSSTLSSNVYPKLGVPSTVTIMIIITMPPSAMLNHRRIMPLFP